MTPPRSFGRRALAGICLAAAGWGFSFGLGAPLASLWLRDAWLRQSRYADTIIGLNSTVYYLAIALTAAAVPRLVRRWGIFCPIVGMALSGVTVALFPWGAGATGWFGLRFLNGAAGALTIIPLETLVNQRSEDRHRARNFGIYAVSMALGWAAGSCFGLDVYTRSVPLSFLLGGAASAIAGMVFFVFMAAEAPAPCVEAASRREPLSWRPHFLSFGSAWAQGFLEGGMVGLLPVFLLSLGLSEQRVGGTLAGIMLGVIVLQVPVAWLADRLGKTGVLLGCYAATMTGLIGLVGCGQGPWLTAWLFVVGAFSGAFYPLGLAVLGDRAPPTQLASANAWYLAINCVGSLSGPAVCGAAMDLFGGRAMFVVAHVAVAAVLLLWAVSRYGSNSDRGLLSPNGLPSAPGTRTAA